MEKTLTQQLQSRLEEEKKKLEDQLADIATKDKKLKDDYDAKFQSMDDGPFDHSAEASEVANYQDNLSLEENLELQLRDVNKALKDIEEGVYGKCENCGGDISDERLKALPHARLCLKCAKK